MDIFSWKKWKYIQDNRIILHNGTMHLAQIFFYNRVGIFRFHSNDICNRFGTDRKNSYEIGKNLDIYSYTFCRFRVASAIIVRDRLNTLLIGFPTLEPIIPDYCRTRLVLTSQIFYENQDFTRFLPNYSDPFRSSNISESQDNLAQF